MKDYYYYCYYSTSTTSNRLESIINTPRSMMNAIKTPAYYPQSPSNNNINSPGWNPNATPNYWQAVSPNPHKEGFASPGNNYR